MARSNKENCFLGLKLDALSFDETLDYCDELIRSRGKQHVVLNAAKVVAASKSDELTRIINNSDIVNADGMSVVWAARLLGIKIPERVSGIDLMNRLVDLSSTKGYSIFLLGSEQNVLDAVFSNFVERKANIVGIRDGFWQANEEPYIVEKIASTSPDILFVAIPSPAKEVFLSRHLEDLNTGLVVGVGGSFDVVAGKVKRAPLAAQKVGLEWFFRLLQEPRRMLKRYLVGNTEFMILVGKSWLKSKRIFIRKH